MVISSWWSLLKPVYSLNYAQAGAGAKVTLGASSSPQNIVSVSITTTGNPVRVSAYGDAENSSVGYWSKLQLYRGSTPIGSIVHTEGSAGSENSPFAFSHIDNPSAGTYIYYLKAVEISGGNISFGESAQPTINVQELNGSGSSGTSFASPYSGNLNGTAGQAWMSSYGATASINWNNGNVQTNTLAASTTFTFANPNNGATYILVIKQAAAGNYTITWPSVTWSGGTTPTMTATANKTDIYTFVYVNSIYYGSYVQNF